MNVLIFGAHPFPPPFKTHFLKASHRLFHPFFLKPSLNSIPWGGCGKLNTWYKFFKTFQDGNFQTRFYCNCSAWLRLNTKIDFHTTHPPPTTNFSATSRHARKLKFCTDTLGLSKVRELTSHPHQHTIINPIFHGGGSQNLTQVLARPIRSLKLL